MGNATNDIKVPSRNIYKSFRSPKDNTSAGNALVHNSKRWDEPTYQTFSVFFKMGISENWRNQAKITNYDRFPHPLLNVYQEDNYEIRDQYSTIQFLRDNNETIREEMLKRFISDLDDIQTYYPWYFQSIGGINTLLNIMPERGRRIPKDGKITLRVLEGIDQKMTNLLTLYRKIVWDDVYQRWMLPDMMRNFVMEIYITEFRTFHESRIKDNPEEQVIPTNRGFFGSVANYLYTNVPVVNNAVNLFKKSTIPESVDLVLDSVRKTMPTLKITCERCEIDISSIDRHIDAYSIGDIPEQQMVEFDIKVGQIKEEYVNPILDYYFSDKVINGKSRSIIAPDPVSGGPVGGFGAGSFGGNTAANMNYAEAAIRPSQNAAAKRAKNFDPEFAQHESNAYTTHISGTPFNESQNDKKAISKRLGTDGIPPKSSTFEPDFDPVLPNTWGQNVINLGRSALENFGQEKIAQFAMTKIPGLGISLNEAIAAIESKNFVTLMGLVTAAINRVHEQTKAPSEELDKGIIESTVKQFLLNITLSEATDDDAIELKEFARQALHDRSILGKILDYSAATDLVSESLGEVNLPTATSNPDSLVEHVEELTKGDRSKATDLDGDTSDLTLEPIIYDGVPNSATTSDLTLEPIIYDGVPSSTATSNPIHGVDDGD